MENRIEKAKQIIVRLIDEKKISGEEAVILMETLFLNNKEHPTEDEIIWDSIPLSGADNVMPSVVETAKGAIERFNEEIKKAAEPQKVPQTFEEWQKYPNGYTVVEDRGVYVDPITGESYPQQTYKYIQNPYRPIHTYLNGKRLTENSVD